MVNDKIKTAFTLTSALITAISALGYFIAKETQFYWILIPTFLSLMAFISAVAIGIGLFRPTNFEYVDPMVIVNEYRGKGYPLRFFLNKWASTISDTVNGNADVVNAKETGLNRMYSLIVIGLAIFATSFLFLAISLL